MSGSHGPSLRTLAAARDLDLGAAVAPRPLCEEPEYAATLAREFSMVTAENALKMGPLRPGPEEWSFADADAIVDFAAHCGQKVRGHTLVWHSQVPRWAAAAPAGDLASILEAHIDTVVGRYEGRIRVWDVINEAVTDDGALRDTLWLRGMGPDYLANVLRRAHRADPLARLFYNDYGAEGCTAKAEAVYLLLRGLLDTGVPVHGVGLQMHIPLEGYPNADDVAANMARLAGLDLEIHITELDVRLPLPVADAALEAQARVYQDILQVCLDCPACTALVLWGFTDRHSWVPHFFDGCGDALIYDAAYRPKPAREAMARVLAESAL